MQTKITIRNEAQTCYIDIEGIIGVPEQNQFDNAASRVATYETFRREVARIAEVAAASVVVNIRSTGGDVNDALLIYEALQSLGARITTRCYGYTASAATIIAQAADEGRREISSNALYLIHNSTCAIEGNSATLQGRAELLRKTDARLARLYADRSGRDEGSFAELMAENDGAGRWLTAEETVEAGLADRIIDALLTGVSIPDPDSAEPPTPEAPDPVAPNPDSQSGGDMPSARAEAVGVVDSVAGTIARYLLRRFAYRWEQFMERMREKREAKQEARRERKKADIPAEPQPSKGAEHVDKKPAAGGDASVRAAVATAPIAFDEGQRRYGRTEVEPVEDPSMNAPRSQANERAYSDDAKAFASRS